MHLSTAQVQDAVVCFIGVSFKDIVIDADRIVNNAVRHNLHKTSSFPMGINGHENDWFHPSDPTLVGCFADDGLHRVISFQLQVEVLQAVRLICEEGEEVAPISLGAGIDVGMMGKLHGPSEAANAS